MSPSAFEFHAGTEGFAAFVRRSRVPIVLCGGVFASAMLVAIFSVDPAYYYPRLITDQLLYYLKAQSFVVHGTTDASVAVNLAPFNYAAAPGLLRAPFMYVFADFDDQLRAIQVTNVAMAVMLGTLFAYVVSWVLPLRLHSAAVAYSFATLLFNPVWATNVLSPLADLPYALASLGALVVLTRLVCGTTREQNSVAMMALLVALFALAFVFRFTAPVLLAYGWVLHRSRHNGGDSGGRISRRVYLAILAILGLLIALNFRTIVFGYLWQPTALFARGDRAGMLINIFANAVPTAVIPGFDLLYRYHPLTSQSHLVFGSSPPDIVILVVASVISACVIAGMWAERRRLSPELAYVLAPLAVLAAMVPSTARYLLSYQPIVWMFMYAGTNAAFTRVSPRVSWRPAYTGFAILVACGALGGLLYVRSARLAGEGRVTLSNFSPGASRRHAPEVAQIYRALRTFLESVPGDRSLIIGERAATGQWKAIAGRDHYMPDSNLVAAARSHEVYLVVACPTRVECTDFDGADARARERLFLYGRFKFDQVFAARNVYASARVYRLTAAQ